MWITYTNVLEPTRLVNFTLEYCSSCGYPLSVAAYEELKAADNEELNKVKKHLQELESDRITKEDLDEIRRQWMIELQKERAPISLSEWNALKKEMYEIYEMLDIIIKD
jgi:hypothetical protein